MLTTFTYKRNYHYSSYGNRNNRYLLNGCLHLLNSNYLNSFNKVQLLNFKDRFADNQFFNNGHVYSFEKHFCRTDLQCHHCKVHLHLRSFLFFDHSLHTFGNQATSMVFFGRTDTKVTCFYSLFLLSSYTTRPIKSFFNTISPKILNGRVSLHISYRGD